MATTTQNFDLAEFLDCDFPDSTAFIQIDTGWHEIDGNIVGGWHVRITTYRGTVETHGSFRDALMRALAESGIEEFPGSIPAPTEATR